MIESLDEDDGIRRRDLAAAIDLVVVSVDASELARLDPATVELLLDGAGEEAQVCWHAFGSAAGVDRDLMAALVTASQRADRISMLADDSARWWTECGGRPPAAEVPHPAVLARRVFSREVLERRIEFLRAVDAWPHEGRPIVVQGCRDDLEIVERLAAAAKGRSVVAIVADSANGDSAFADAVVANVESAFLLPDMAGTAPTEDRVAAIAGAGGVLAASSVVRDVARSFEVPSASLHEFASRASSDFDALFANRETIDEKDARLDDDFDAIARLAGSPGPGVLAWSELAALRAALDARGRRLTAERIAMADAMSAERERGMALEKRLADLDAAHREVIGKYHEITAAYDDVVNLEVVRWRTALGRLRHRLRLGRK